MEIQDGHMRSCWPKFIRRGDAKRSTWTGFLQPLPSAPRYEVRVEYTLGQSPDVRVLSPQLPENAPHIYRPGVLCLYHPDEWEWHGRRVIARTIVPWADDWLYFYELWQECGEWLAPEAPHDDYKRSG
jgi:hypothetical protein